MADQNGGASGIEFDLLLKGIKSIVAVVLKEGDADSGTDANAKKSAADAAKAVGVVTGADILQAMIGNNGDAAKFAKELTGNVSAIPKDATIAGGIVLRSMTKGGKFAGPSDNASADAKKVVESAAVSAVIKALDTLR
ncbi:Variable outer membrane protein (plasmid) [Borrelia crocidurae DOU]|uniref:Variable large protein n=1 Tax=Borrelia crocidurae DOU TaxID=1293575 RepID=W5SLH5_9SPIR|nr:Variable outer membrane protein [Borrelia crocidurae DOU]